jgi:hypothetical protein
MENKAGQKAAELIVLNSVGTCVNCVCLQSQLREMKEELKSLQTIMRMGDLILTRCSKRNQLEETVSQVQGKVIENVQSQDFNSAQKWTLAKDTRRTRRTSLQQNRQFLPTTNRYATLSDLKEPEMGTAAYYQMNG